MLSIIPISPLGSKEAESLSLRSRPDTKSTRNLIGIAIEEMPLSQKNGQMQILKNRLLEMARERSERASAPSASERSTRPPSKENEKTSASPLPLCVRF